MQTIIIIIVVVIIIPVIIIIIVWFGPKRFFSIHRRKGSYLVYLINWTIFLYIWRFFVLLSSAGLFPWCSNGLTIQSHTTRSSIRSKAFYSHLQKQLFLVTRFRKNQGIRSKVELKTKKRRMEISAALGFTPCHEVLKELSGVERCRPLSDED